MIFAAVVAAGVQARAGAGEIPRDDLLFIADLDTLQLGLVGQQLVEIGALHLVGAAVALGELVAEIEFGVALAPAEGRAVLGLETGRLDRLEHAGFLDEIQAVRQQALADGEAREALALEDQHVMALALEQRAGDGTGRAGTDDHDFTLL